MSGDISGILLLPKELEIYAFRILLPKESAGRYAGKWGCNACRPCRATFMAFYSFLRSRKFRVLDTPSEGVKWGKREGREGDMRTWSNGKDFRAGKQQGEETAAKKRRQRNGGKDTATKKQWQRNGGKDTATQKRRHRNSDKDTATKIQQLRKKHRSRTG